MDVFNSTKIEYLNDRNYAIWSMRMEALLEAKQLFEVIANQTPIKNERDPTSIKIFEDWSRKNNETLGYMILSMSPEIAIIYKGIKNARQIWNSLRERFEGETEDKAMNLFLELTKLKKQHNENIDNYITRAQGLCNQISQLGKFISERELVRYIIEGLPDNYSSISTALVMNRNIPIGNLRQILLDFEKKMMILNAAMPIGQKKGKYLKNVIYAINLAISKANVGIIPKIRRLRMDIIVTEQKEFHFHQKNREEANLSETQGHSPNSKREFALNAAMDIDKDVQETVIRGISGKLQDEQVEDSSNLNDSVKSIEEYNKEIVQSEDVQVESNSHEDEIPLQDHRMDRSLTEVLEENVGKENLSDIGKDTPKDATYLKKEATEREVTLKRKPKGEKMGHNAKIDSAVREENVIKRKEIPAKENKTNREMETNNKVKIKIIAKEAENDEMSVDLTHPTEDRDYSKASKTEQVLEDPLEVQSTGQKTREKRGRNNGTSALAKVVARIRIDDDRENEGETAQVDKNPVIETESAESLTKEGADQVGISDNETESIDDIEERVVRVPASRKLIIIMQGPVNK
ncbi:hypothetical protein LAZ67_11003683 [Cordylochernes scorpioides]|uniref:DUF4219 domain-containing protein n=1 Tax=Cordylochernes scorpioides TaxID=51811 RepID=A0ABY6L0U0_9ARAC|nr:hypothetical protein LAZ67_11003683 [Cordylochernes scorpioides]